MRFPCSEWLVEFLLAAGPHCLASSVTLPNGPWGLLQSLAVCFVIFWISLPIEEIDAVEFRFRLEKGLRAFRKGTGEERSEGCSGENKRMGAAEARGFGPTLRVACGKASPVHFRVRSNGLGRFGVVKDRMARSQAGGNWARTKGEDGSGELRDTSRLPSTPARSLSCHWGQDDHGAMDALDRPLLQSKVDFFTWFNDGTLQMSDSLQARPVQQVFPALNNPAA